MPRTPEQTERDIDRFLRLCASDKPEAVERALAKGMPVNVTNDVGFSPLMSAARNFRADAVELLLDHGAEVHARSEDGSSPLHLAVSSSPAMPAWHSPGLGPTNQDLQVCIVRALLAAGADPSTRTHIGFTPLMSAAWSGSVEAARILVEVTPELDATDSQGRSAHDIALFREHEDIAALLD